MKHSPFLPRTLRKLILLLAVVAGSSFCPLAPADSPDRPRQAWFVVASMPEGIENPVQVMIGDRVHEVALAKRRASDPVRLSSGAEVRIAAGSTDPDQVEEATTILARTCVPESVRQALIVLAPTRSPDENTPPLDALVVDLAEFENGSFLFVNRTLTDIRVELGDREATAEPDRAIVTGLPDLSEAVSAAITYSHYDREHEVWRQLGASTVVVLPSRRELCIFTQKGEFSRIDYHGVQFPALE